MSNKPTVPDKKKESISIEEEKRLQGIEIIDVRLKEEKDQDEKETITEDIQAPTMPKLFTARIDLHLMQELYIDTNPNIEADIEANALAPDFFELMVEPERTETIDKSFILFLANGFYEFQESINRVKSYSSDIAALKASTDDTLALLEATWVQP